MQNFNWASLKPVERMAALKRPVAASQTAIDKAVNDILNDVAQRGDDAVKELTRRLDGVDLEKIRVSQDKIDAALKTIPAELLAAMRLAIQNITTFHAQQKPKTYDIETMPGVVCALQWRPIPVVGLYVPGGSAPLFSSVMMQAVPAKLAGCEKIILCSPPEKTSGEIPAVILAAASLCGIQDIYAVGGAQAIAAMAFGTETVPKADKIFGPGNAYVMRAKEIVAQREDGPAIDMAAGPSEVMVVADGSVSAGWAAADLLAQAEHDPLAQAVLVVTSQAFAKEVQAGVERQMQDLPRRDIIAQSLKTARFFVVDALSDAIEIVNAYAPEHLILQCRDAESLLPDIINAGAVFIGPFSPETAGDYASGANHVLPTSGRCRAASGLTLASFMKSITVQTISATGIEALAPILATLARAEGLEAHARAALCRVCA